MDQDKLWAKFEKSGAVSDYLKYCGVDLEDAGVNAVEAQTEGGHETGHRSTDHSGKQQHR